MPLESSGFWHGSSVKQLVNLTGREAEVVAWVLVFDPLVSGVFDSNAVDTLGLGVGAPGSLVGLAVDRPGGVYFTDMWFGGSPGVSLDPLVLGTLATFCFLG